MAQALARRTEVVEAQVMNNVFMAIPAIEEHAEFLRIQRTLFLESMRKKVKNHEAGLTEAAATSQLQGANVTIALLCNSDVSRRGDAGSHLDGAVVGESETEASV